MRISLSRFFIALGIGLTIGTSAYVPKINDAGVVTHWSFDDPPPSVASSIFNRTTRAIRFSLAEDAFSEAHRESELNALRNAIGQWEAVPGTFLKFEEGDLAPETLEINPSDDTNIIKWAKGSTLINGGKTDIRNRLGLALTLFFADGRMAAADIALNGVEIEWFADPSNIVEDAHFIEGAVMHELGHVLGLDHTAIATATMFARDGDNLGFQFGLSSDEIAFVQTVYGEPATLNTLGTIEGEVTIDGQGALGAALFLEQDGIIIASTVSREATDINTTGFYEFLGVPPGTYELRVQPLASATVNRALVRGRDISFSRFNDADVDFLPTEAISVSVTAGNTVVRHFDLDSAAQPFLIDRIRGFTENPNSVFAGNSPVTVLQGETDLRLGVFGPDLPTENVELIITGDGLTMGPTEINTQFFNGLPHLFRTVSVAPNATPGMRSFIVQRGSDLAYASGFIEVRATDPDDNFDGLSDNFQRQFFSPFTSAEAGPDADPDGDGLSNREEAIASTNPTIPNGPNPSTDPFEIQSVTLTTNGAVIVFESSESVSYQLYTRERIAQGEWQPVGVPQQANSGTTTIVDPSASGDIRFYEVRTVD